MFYVGVDDLQAKVDAAQALGAKTVMPPMDVPGGPSIAMFTHPDGNLIGLMRRPNLGVGRTTRDDRPRVYRHRQRTA